MKAIGIFGGTFDPVHLGHRHILEAAFDAVEFEKVFVIPAKIPPHKSASGMTSEKERFEMCRLAFSDIDKVEISDCELRREGKSYSILTIEYFRTLYPEHRMYFIMGSDQLLTFESWYRSRDILELCDIIAVSREDEVSFDELREYAGKLTPDEKKITVLNIRPFRLSSTSIREMLINKSDCSCYLDKKVLEYIKSNNLYTGRDPEQMCEKNGKKKYSEYRAYIKENLSKKRAQHSFNVADAAVRLAKMYDADEDKAYIAGILHDVCKELTADQQLELVMKCRLDVCDIEKNTPALFHAVAGSVFVGEHFGITDEEIIRAIRYHTVACGNMDKLSKIIYLADLISEDRDYKDVKKMRKYAEQGLDKAMLEALKFSIADSVGKENLIPQCTFDCYNEMVKAEKSKEE